MREGILSDIFTVSVRGAIDAFVTPSSDTLKARLEDDVRKGKLLSTRQTIKKGADIKANL